MSLAELNSRWIEDLTIELNDERPSGKLKLVVITSDNRKEDAIKKSEEKILRRDRKGKILCHNVKEVTIRLLQVHYFSTDSLVLSTTIPLNDDDEINHKDAENKAAVWLKLSRGSLQERVDDAGRITDDQKVILDKIEKIRGFFDGVKNVCDAVKEIHPYIEGASNALLLIYKLFEKQEKCRDTARELVEEMEDVLKYGLNRLRDSLYANEKTREALISIAEVIRDASDLIVEEDESMIKAGIRDAFSGSYKSKLDKLRDRLRKEKEGLRDSISFGIWTKIERADLERNLQFIPTAHYRSGEGCLKDTRVDLLGGVDGWVRDEEEKKKKTVWVKGHAGSGKSALMNSIAKRLEAAGIPFTCFMCKRDDTERSDALRILPTIAYDLTRHYGDYRGRMTNFFEELASRSLATADIINQIGLLFGDSPSYEVISPKGADRPLFHVILIDALDECRDVRQRSLLAKSLRLLAAAVPWIKVIITSRPEPDLENVLGSACDEVDLVNINDENWNTDTDIRLFIEHEAGELKLDIRPGQVTQLQKKAAGLFIWCSTVFRFIEKSMDDKSRTLETILEIQAPVGADGPHTELYLLYQHVLDNSPVITTGDRLLMQSILSVVFVASSRRPLTADAISDILYPYARTDKDCQSNRKRVLNIIQSLFAILYVEEDTSIIRTCHPSVFDYTEGKLSDKFYKLVGDEEKNLRAPFSARLLETHKRVFDGCFTIMARDLRFNICSLEDSSLLNKDVLDLPTRIKQCMSEAFQYSLSFWFSHLERSGFKDTIDAILEFLKSPKALYWVEGMSLLGAVDRCVLILQDCVTFFTDRSDIVDISNEWERLLLAYREALQSTPHLYLSALPWLPRTSQLRGLIQNSFPLSLPNIANVMTAWNAERLSEHIGGMVMSVAFPLNAQFFAAGSRDGNVYLWESRSGKRIRQLDTSVRDLTSIDISRDGHSLASAHRDEDFTLQLWDLSEDDPRPKLLKGHTGEIYSVSFSTDGKRLVSGSWDKTIRIWNVESGALIGDPLEGHTDYVTSVTFSADNKRIFSTSDKTVRIWDSRTGKQLGEPLKADSWVLSVASSPDGRFIAYNGGGYVILSNAKTGTPIEKLEGHTDYITSVCFSADSTYLASSSHDRSIRVWNVENRTLACTLRGHMNTIRSVSFSPDGRRILSGSTDGSVKLWDFKETVSPDKPSEGRSKPVYCVAYSPDGSRIASGSEDGKICVWDAHTGVAVGEPLLGHAASVNAIAFSGDGQWLVSGSRDASLRIWDIVTGTGTLLSGHTGYVTAVAVSRDSKLIASGSSDNTVHLWDLVTHKIVAVFRHNNQVGSVAFTVDGHSLISADRTARMWDIQTRLVVEGPFGYPDSDFWTICMAMSLDGQWITTSSSDRISTWKMSSCTEPYSTLYNSNHAMYHAFSPNNGYLLNISKMNHYGGEEIQFYNVQTGHDVGDPLKFSTFHCNPPSCSNSPDGQDFAIGTYDGTISVCDSRARTDPDLFEDRKGDYSDLKEGLQIRWNVGRARMDEGHGWVRDYDRERDGSKDVKLLLWVPAQYRQDLKNGTKLVIGNSEMDPMRPQVDYSSLFRYSGSRWVDIYDESKCVDSQGASGQEESVREESGQEEPNRGDASQEELRQEELIPEESGREEPVQEESSLWQEPSRSTSELGYADFFWFTFFLSIFYFGLFY